MVQRQPHARPAPARFVGNALERLERQRLVRFVLQIPDAPALVVVAHQAEKRHDRAVAASVRAATAADTSGSSASGRADGQKRSRHPFSIG